MDIISPSTYVYDCKCDCGAHFIATENDFITEKIRVRDPFYSANDAWGDDSYHVEAPMLKCPFCGRFVIKGSNLTISHLQHCYQQKTPEKLFEHNFEVYDKERAEKYDKIKIEIKKWQEVRYLTEKYQYGETETISEL